MEIKNCVSILISADFLKISKLIEDAAQFICNNINEIVALPIDMKCINEKLVRVIANKIRLEDLDRLIDKKDKLMSKLYMRKLDNLLIATESKFMLQRCAYCNKLYCLQA